jgi:hypothetical protein
MQAKKQTIAKIESLFPNLNILSFPYRKEQMHLLISNPENGKKLRIRVLESRNYLDVQDVVNESFRPYLKYSGWWTFQPAEVNKTSADLWILIWPGEVMPVHSLLLPFAELSSVMAKGCSTGSDGKKHFYWYIPNDGNGFAARTLGAQGVKSVLEGVSPLDSSLNLDTYTDAWQKYIGDVLN